MSGKLSEDEVKKIAKLARLPLGDEEVKRYAGQLTNILKFVSKLQKVKPNKVEMRGSKTELVNVYREDEADQTRMLTQTQALKNAKASYKGFFKVPAIFE